MVELPSSGWQHYLTRLEFQGDLEYSQIFGCPGANKLLFDPALDYSGPYLNYSSNSEIPWPLDNVCLFIELNIERTPSGGENNALSMLITPGLAYMTPASSITAGLQLPLNHHASRAENVAAIGSVIIPIAKIDPLAALTAF
jgi:hypothetical protein